MRKLTAGKGVGLFGTAAFVAALLVIRLTTLPWTTPARAEIVQATALKTPQRDWKAAPAIVEVDTIEDIYALGDVHGDYHRLIKILAAGKVIAEEPKTPAEVQWRAGKAILVCTGDLIDKGDNALSVIALFQALQAAAAKAGGQVIVTMGNHEAEFLAAPDDDRKAEEFLEELSEAGIAPDQVAAGRDKLGVGKFLLSMPIASRVNDWFFVHAGNTKGLSLKDLKRALQSCVDADGFGATILSKDDSLLEARMHPAPWWESSGETSAQHQARLTALVKALGVRHLVFGHQPGKVLFSDRTERHKGTLVQKFDGLVFLIDVGMSKSIDKSHGAILKIHKRGSEATVHFPDGTKETIWTK